ncbi:Fic family protein [Pelotomaculum sp. PtaB.Bin117]|uniref:Fic family protein n=1 Tax=Pelotomaculum sp. PtaB.Bin117 TaxID=1811694 RepID=UPI0009C70C4F|nr:Fic family protein [Pelotomaculum sp. PtaB.Bin117]OPX88159.1 MAG: Adenosine monophosphate-protein transferase SoFic [Pelotomaculum sp. PtaB.Bin117]
MKYIRVSQAAEQWGLSDRRVRVLCEQGKIEGVTKDGRSYLIPADAVKPIDGRSLRGKNVPQEFAALFLRIDAMKAELNKRRTLTEGELKCLQEEFLVEFTYNSNAIEGNTLTLKETAMVLEGITIDKKPLKDHLEAVGHRDAFLYIQQLIKDKAPFSERVIKDVHSLVLMDRPEDKGVYRRIPVRIADAYHEPPQPYLVPGQMEQLITEFEKKKLHPIESAALFHLKFQGIHPFIDGNGRTGRLILNFMLMQNGYPPTQIKFVDRKRYYECFDSYHSEGSTEPMIKLIAEYVEKTLRRFLKILEENY